MVKNSTVQFSDANDVRYYVSPIFVAQAEIYGHGDYFTTDIAKALPMTKKSAKLIAGRTPNASVVKLNQSAI